MKMKFRSLMFWLSLSQVLVFCGVNAGNPNSSSDSNPKTAFVSLKLTDAPSDLAEHFYVTATSVEIVDPESNENELVSFGEPVKVDVLSLRNGETLTLLDEKEISIGSYSEIRLHLAEESEVEMVTKDGKTLPIFVQPTIVDDDNTHLKFNGALSLGEDDKKELIVDVDLRKSLRLISDDNRAKHNIDGKYTYALMQDHSFKDREEYGQVKGASFESKWKYFCLWSSDSGFSLEDNRDCIDEAALSAYNDGGFFHLLIVRAGTYRLAGVADDDSFEVLKEDIVVSADGVTEVSP